ncbi:MAG: hypothetical protein ACI89L_002520 [Phycisphaerales bacterium]|jgi:hypothetical protein
MASPDTDKELPALLKKAKKKKMFFGLVTAGTDGKLIVSKKPVKSSALKAVKKEISGKKIVRGECLGEGGVLVFYADTKPPAGVEKLVKRLAKAAGVPIKPEFKLGPAPKA